MDSQKFTDFGFIEPISHALRDIEYTVPTPVQIRAIPPLLAGRDLLGCAQTGTGKTAAFALPIIQHLAKNPRKPERGVVRSLILTPTRELAAQIHQNLKMYTRYLKMSTVVVYGGVGQGPQVKSLGQGVDILVATPGRLLDLIGQGYIKLHSVEIFVLDEADRMLDMGFIPDVRRILGYVPKKRQTMFLSATMPPKVVQLAKTMVHDPVRVDVTPERPVVEFIEQRLMMVEVRQKTTVLVNILKDPGASRALVFTRTKHGANKLVRLLGRAGISATGIHGNKTQSARQKAMDDFKAGRIRVLVATDIAARGIDVEGITHVINHDIPNIAETYVHRIGRTARAGCRGISISLCSPEEQSFIRDIEKLIRQPIPVVSEIPYMSRVELKAEEEMPRTAKPHSRKPRSQQSQGPRGRSSQGGRGDRSGRSNRGDRDGRNKQGDRDRQRDGGNRGW
ncbi:MAG: DEAD/DEAH box helicase [Candidatus Thermoplasmatota archaeon]|nr:DEAD/DEAH box helicase [Euryarchaeota archaeon]MBU4032298.1 DEAD/DEAH box helicase [Candidatus Thermoplasmatota archaeon]MBU4071459.1 DEAD/DEAH box helicase [Candidatus Thermoplasmatota archaeon]MBU4144437.1 DEAD/DEAH box helicase [Candidatus Thermoplasmatota archaeon]MBU4592331.1 DEAD/DEAH box helicase [Candidatus Thermoplasmatota archaeon]